MKILLYIEFDGRYFYGYQIQNNYRTVQGEIKKVLEKLFGKDVKFIGPSRTDRFVHAKRYPVLLSNLKTTIPPDRVSKVLNINLPEDIRVIKSFRVSEDFNIRYNVVGKTYSYKIRKSPYVSPIYRNYAYTVDYDIDIYKMQKAKYLFLGKKDFSGFMSQGSNPRNTVKTIYDIRIIQKNNFITVYINASGYLYNMVRIIVSTLLDVARGFIKEEDIIEIFETGKRGKSIVIPGYGLYLEDVEFKEIKEI